VSREFRRVSTDEMLAYVDDCLSPGERAAFKDRMIENPEINSQIEIWLFQNEAIRAAFPVPSRSRVSAAEGESVGRSFAPELALAGMRAMRAGEESDWRPNALPRASVGPPRPDSIPLAPARAAITRWNVLIAVRRTLSILVGVVAFWIAGVFFSDHSVEFVKSATTANRSFADNMTRPVEVATGDRDFLNRWFAPQILRALAIPDLSGAGLTLLGGRIVPGAFSPAQYLLYENPQHERIALEIEAIDAPPETNAEISQIGAILCASWSGTGHSFALVGRVSRARLADLARLVRENEPGN
jgi:anti-sigma factor RsiW